MHSSAGVVRSRRLAMQTKAKMVPVKKKTERREMTRELKAEQAAKVQTLRRNHSTLKAHYTNSSCSRAACRRYM